MTETLSEERTVRTINTIAVRNRYRHDYGDLDGLKASIARVGLIQPVVITANGDLIAGARRLRACTELGWTEVPVHVITSLTDAHDRLMAERDENTERKAMTPSEVVALSKAIEAVEVPRARERMTEGSERGAAIRRGNPSAASGVGVRQETRRTVAEMVGIGHTNLAYAKKIVARAEAGDLRAIEARNQMDRTGKIQPAYEFMIGRKLSNRQPVPIVRPKASPKLGPRRRHVQVIEAMATSLSGLAIAADDITELDTSITSEEATRLKGDLSTSLGKIRRLVALLSKETTK